MREAHVAQALLQILGLDVLVALDLELGDGGPLDHHDQQGVAVAAQFHVAEEPRRVQRAHGLADALAVEVIADVHRQVIEYRAFGDSLQTFDANVADRERLAATLARAQPIPRAGWQAPPGKPNAIQAARDNDRLLFRLIMISR